MLCNGTCFFINIYKSMVYGFFFYLSTFKKEDEKEQETEKEMEAENKKLKSAG